MKFMCLINLLFEKVDFLSSKISIGSAAAVKYLRIWDLIQIGFKTIVHDIELKFNPYPNILEIIFYVYFLSHPILTFK